MITYTDTLDGLTVDALRGGFFVGWPNPPSPEAHLRILACSAAIGLAKDEDGQVVGFVTAISDGVVSAYLPLLEVLPAFLSARLRQCGFQGKGVGSELVRRIVDRFRHLYMVDLLCDATVQPFYARLGLRPTTGMVLRNYDRQSCS